jgi:RNA polymerase sigma factor (sigma-70 family)
MPRRHRPTVERENVTRPAPPPMARHAGRGEATREWNEFCLGIQANARIPSAAADRKQFATWVSFLGERAAPSNTLSARGPGAAWNAIRVNRVRRGVTSTLRLVSAAPFTADRGEAFAREVTATRRELGRFAYLLVGSSAAADDLLAEAYARAWPHYRRGNIENLPAYVRSCMTNLAKGRFRRVRLERREVETRRIDWRAPRLQAPESGFEHHVDAQDELWRAIWQLPVDQRAVIILRHAEDRSEEETAALLGVSLGTVKSRLSRGLATLRSKLERAQTKGAPGARR